MEQIDWRSGPVKAPWKVAEDENMISYEKKTVLLENWMTLFWSFSLDSNLHFGPKYDVTELLDFLGLLCRILSVGRRQLLIMF